MRGLAAYAMQGRLQAVIVVCGMALLSMVLPLFSLLSAAALAVVSLRKGLVEGGLVFLSSAAVVALLGLSTAGSVMFAVIYSLLIWGPIFGVALYLRHSGRLAAALHVLLAVCVLAIFGIYAVVADPAAMWLERLKVLLQPMIEHAPEGFDSAAMLQNMELFSHYMSGLFVTGSAASLVLSLLLARWWQAGLFNPGGFRTEFTGLRLSAVVAYLGVALMAVSALTEGGAAELARNLVMPFGLLYLLEGFAVLHAVVASDKSNTFVLIGIYIGLFFIPHLLLLLALLGLSDVWLDLRRRGARAGE